MKSCILPGSFDPFTLGHLDIVRRAAKIFDKVYVAVMVNSEKRGLFDFSQRKKIAEVSVSGIPGVEVLTADGLLVDLAAALGASAIIKGVRNGTDFDYEMMLATVNRFLAGRLETIWIPARADYSFISSAFVRELIKYGRPLDGVIHADAIAIIENNFCK